MVQTPMLSVIVPVYNAEETLERCLGSIQKQTYSNYEAILVNDGSKDKSGELCDKYAKSDKHFKVIHTENHGVSSARNIGLEQALGKYVMFIDSDDNVRYDYFQVYVSCIEETQEDVVIGGLVCKEGKHVNIKSIEKNGRMKNDIWELICMNPEMYGYIAGKILRLAIIKENAIKFNEKMYSQEDLDFNLSVYEKCVNFQLIDYAGYEYEYIPGKRKPPVWDFLGNSLKMYTIGSQKICLSIEAEEAIKDRIVRQVFAFLYYCGNTKEYEFAMEKLNSVVGLRDYLREQKIKGESKLIIEWLLAEKYERIYSYFQARKKIKALLRRPVS